MSWALQQNLDLNENLTNPNNPLINTTTTSTLQPENPNNETTTTFVLSTNEENVTTTEENVIDTNTTSVTTTANLTTTKDLRRDPPKKNSSNAHFMSEKLMFLCLLLLSLVFIA